MSDCTKDVGNGYYSDEEELSIGELFGYVFNHFKLIVLITLVVTLIGVCYALVTPESYEVSALLKIQVPYGEETMEKYSNSNFSSTEIMHDIFLRSNIEAAIKNTPGVGKKEIDYEDIAEELKYEEVEGTNNWKIYIEKTSSPEYWTALISNLVEPVMGNVVESYKSYVEAAGSEIEKRIAEYEELKSGIASSSTDDTYVRSYQTAIMTLEGELRDVEQFEKNLSSSLTWVQTPERGNKSVGRSRIVICLIFFFMGGVIGVITALVLGFTDKRIYNSTKLKDTVDTRLIASIPLYKKGAGIERREFKYIAEKLALEKDDTLSILTLSEKAGGKTISSALEKEMDAKVINLGLLSEKPDVISSIRCSSYTLVVLRAGCDNYTVLEKFISDMSSLGVDKYGFVLNGVDKSDKDVTLYSDKSSYTSHKWLLETWESYYKKNM